MLEKKRKSSADKFRFPLEKKWVVGGCMQKKKIRTSSFLNSPFFYFQIAAAVSVSTGCISYGICIAYTSPAIPSILDSNQTTSLTNILGAEEISWMSMYFFFLKSFWFYIFLIYLFCKIIL